MSRPRVDPAVVGALTAAAPARLIRKLDKDPERAEAWDWSESGGRWTIATDGDAVVTLEPDGGDITAADQVGCSCLLSPKCLHLLSVLTRLELADATAPGAPEEAAGADADGAPVTTQPSAELDADQAAAAGELRAVLVELVDAGLGSCGVIRQGTVLRAVHACRIAGLHRLASTGVRIVTAVRALQGRSASFSTARLARDLADGLEITERVAGGRALASDIGVARQRYESIGNLRAAGLCAEPVVTTSGYAGVVTYLVAPDGRLLSVSDVRPGDPSRAREAYRGGVDVGDASLSHRELVRAGLYLTRATASGTGRLGRGKDVGAVAGPAASWTEAPIAPLFARPVAEQVAAALAALELPAEQRPAGCDLLFFEADIVEPGASPIRFLLGGDRVIEGRVVSESRALRFRENLRICGRARARVRVIARLASAELHAVYPIAIAPVDDQIALPDALGGVICVGLDRLAGASIASAPAVGDAVDPDAAVDDDAERAPELDATEAPESERPRDLVDPTASLRRRLHRLVIGGRTTLPASVGPEIERERARFDRSMLSTASLTLGQLWLAARRGPESGGGASAMESAESLARAFARAHAYDRLLARHLIEIAWRD